MSQRRSKHNPNFSKPKRKGKANAKPFRDDNSRAKSYAAFQLARSDGQTTASMGNRETKRMLNQVTPCQTILGGKKVWMRGVRPDHTEYKYPIIVGGMRCGSTEHLSSIRKDGRTLHTCGIHTNIEWVDTGVMYDDDDGPNPFA